MNMALRLLSLAMGVFLLFMGLDKIGWLADSSLLVRHLEEWRGMVRPPRVHATARRGSAVR